MKEDTFKSRVETPSHLMTVVAITLYVAGFTVLSVHHASFGISQLNWP
jgi:hypothetical protein